MNLKMLLGQFARANFGIFFGLKKGPLALVLCILQLEN